MTPRPLIKVCGFTRPEDAALAASLGADLLGLNFHPPSPRYLDPVRDLARLREIAAAAAGATLVGVFVNRPPGEIEETAAAVGLDLVQLHGDEGPEVAACFGARAVKVFRRSAPPAPEEIALYPHAWGFLFDAPPRPRRAAPGPRGAPAPPDPYGGTGHSWDHGVLRALTSEGGAAAGRPMLIAGGIRPGTARAALAASGAAGIDVCSGVESAVDPTPGAKDAELMTRLFEEVRHGPAAP
ncbi:MAG TPA: phosphoribosylanthranilate isomerase [Thermoanaerobaculia bacterium]|nr:phosphoribosylanthranilate isomerase [Thermoanaerobaculia bacterium]